MPTGDTISYEEMGDILGEDCYGTGKGRSIFYAVQKKLERNEGIVLENIPNVGYKRLATDVETLNHVSNRRLPKMRNAARRAKTALGAVDIGSLPKQEQCKALAIGAMLSAATHAMAPKEIERNVSAYRGLNPSDLQRLMSAGFTG